MSVNGNCFGFIFSVHEIVKLGILVSLLIISLLLLFLKNCTGNCRVFIHFYIFYFPIAFVVFKWFSRGAACVPESGRVLVVVDSGISVFMGETGLPPLGTSMPCSKCP